MNNYLDLYVIRGGVMMVFLIPCSIIALALILHGLIELRRERIMPSHISALFAESGNPGDLDELRQRLERDGRSPLARICLRLLPSAGTDGETWEQRIAQVTSEEIATLYQRHGYLGVIYQVAPLLGLLGTILGMIHTFHVYSVAEARSVTQLGRGISEALITTMWGLMIAVPAYIFLTLFQQKLYRYETALIPARVRQLFAGLSASRVSSGAPGGASLEGTV